MAGLLDKAKEFVAENVAKMETPEAEVTDLDLKDVSREGVVYNAKVAVKNPYAVSIPICDIAYDFKSATRDIVSGKIPDPGSLKGHDTTMVEVGVKVPYDAMMSLMKDVGSDWDIDYEIHIDLTVDLPVFGSFTLPVTKKGEIKLPTISDFF